LPAGPAGVALFFVVAGFGFYMLHNTLQARGIELAPTARGSTFALFSASMFLGQGIGPALGGAVAGAAGFRALFVLVGVLVIVMGFVAAHLLKRRA